MPSSAERWFADELRALDPGLLQQALAAAGSPDAQVGDLDQLEEEARDAAHELVLYLASVVRACERSGKSAHEGVLYTLLAAFCLGCDYGASRARSAA